MRLEDEAEAQAVAAEIEERLARVEGVDEVSAAPSARRGWATC